MAAKVTFDPVDRKIDVVGPPVDGVISLNFKVDVYSDGKEDWHALSNLHPMRFPITPIGGDLKPNGDPIGDSYIVEYGWQIMPYEANHEFIIVGNVFARTGQLVADTMGAYTVRVNMETSTLVEVRSSALDASTINQIRDAILTDAQMVDLFTDSLLVRKIGTNRLELADGSTTNWVLYDDDSATPILTWDVSDKSGSSISLPPNAPARRTKAV